VICRWKHTSTSLTLDVMPQAASVLGFSNPWYPQTLATAVARKAPLWHPHGSPTFFAAGIQCPGRRDRVGRGATMVASSTRVPQRRKSMFLRGTEDDGRE
jgi:hypothetical protein